MAETVREKGTPVKITCLAQAGFLPMFKKAGEDLGLDMRLYAGHEADRKPETLREALRSMRESDLVFLYPSGESFWASLGPQLEDVKKSVPVCCLSHDEPSGAFSTATPEVMATASLYLAYHGEKNIANMFRYLCREMVGKEVKCEPPDPIPWDGVYHPDAPGPFASVDSYLDWYRPGNGPMVGLILLRYYWVNKSMDLEDALIRALEAYGMNVLPVFSYSIRAIGSNDIAMILLRLEPLIPLPSTFNLDHIWLEPFIRQYELFIFSYNISWYQRICRTFKTVVRQYSISVID